MNNQEFAYMALGIALIAIAIFTTCFGIVIIKRERRMRRRGRRSIHREISRLDDRIFELEKERIEKDAVTLRHPEAPVG